MVIDNGLITSIIIDVAACYLVPRDK